MLYVGDGFDIVGERKQTSFQKVNVREVIESFEINIRNHKKEAVTVEVIEPMPGDWEVLRATHPHEKLQAFTARWNIPVPKEGATTLGYRTRVRCERRGFRLTGAAA